MSKIYFDSDNTKKNIKKNILLADYTTWHVGGRADYFYEPPCLEELSRVLANYSQEFNITYLGLGSNVLIRDGGIRGMVIHTFPGLNRIQMLGQNRLQVEVGVASPKLARVAVRAGLGGLEFLAGIPGSIGGALTMNAGCDGAAIWNVVESVEMIDRQGQRCWRTKEEFTVNYRQVITPPQESFIQAILKLETITESAGLKKINQLLAHRRHTQPIDFPNSGSVFKNPATSTHAAGWLIEQSGLKNFTIGGAAISQKHANFIINRGEATAEDIEKLITYTIQTVLTKHQVKLQPEVIILGEQFYSLKNIKYKI